MGQSSSDERRSSAIWRQRRKTPYASVRIGAGTEIAIAIEIVGSAHVHDSVRGWAETGGEGVDGGGKGETEGGKRRTDVSDVLLFVLSW